MATAVAGALRDGNPMLVLSVNNRAEHIGWGDAQEVDAVAVLGSITKWSIHVTRPAAIGPALRKAWRLAHSDRPGPVLVDFARDVVEGLGPSDSSLSVESAPSLMRPSALAVAEVADALRQAERPIIWAGRGALPALHDGTLGQLVRHLRIPVLCTFNAMEAAGAFDDLSLGVLSRVGTRLAREAAEASDLVLCLGNSLNGVSTKRWSLRLPKLFQVDVRADRFTDMYPQTTGIEADVGSFCIDLAAAIDPAERWSAWREACSSSRVRWLRELNDVTALADQEPVAPLALMGLFRHLKLDDGQTWSIDASNAGIWAHALTFRNGARVLRPVNFSNMGYALGSAIGAARADRERRAINVLVGDGSLAMSLGDLETAQRLKLPLRIFVLNDCSLSNIRQEVDYKYNRKEEAYDFSDIRFDQVAAGFGIPAVRVLSISELERQISRMSAVAGPCLFDIVTDGGPSVWTDMV
jgi:acetolactate synthase-1/2/3 large subunit